MCKTLQFDDLHHNLDTLLRSLHAFRNKIQSHSSHTLQQLISIDSLLTKMLQKEFEYMKHVQFQVDGMDCVHMQYIPNE